MFKEKLVKHLMSAGQGNIVKAARKYEGPDVGVDNLHITPEEALDAGINKYHLPKSLAQRLGTPAVESLVGQGYTLEQQGRVGSPPNEAQRIVITEQSLREQ
jgi:hypothetical protein